MDGSEKNYPRLMAVGMIISVVLNALLLLWAIDNGQKTRIFKYADEKDWSSVRREAAKNLRWFPDDPEVVARYVEASLKDEVAEEAKRILRLEEADEGIQRLEQAGEETRYYQAIYQLLRHNPMSAYELLQGLSIGEQLRHPDFCFYQGIAAFEFGESELGCRHFRECIGNPENVSHPFFNEVKPLITSRCTDQ